MGKNIRIIIILLSIFLFMARVVSAQDCPALEDAVYYQVQDCNDKANVCINVNLEDILLGNLTISVNDEPYEGNYYGCNLDSTILYSYSTLLGEGDLGPYLLESWYVNGTLFTAQFQDIPELLSLMNTWDPIGNWVKAPNETRITGGDLSQEYSDIHIEQLQVPGTYATLGLNYGTDALGTILQLPVGVHIVEVTDNMACNAGTDIYVACTPNEYLEETIISGLSGEICLDDSQLLGTEFTSSLCGVGDISVVEFVVNGDNNCVSYIAHIPGVETACFIICDELGICDTTYLTVNSLEPPNNIIIETVLLGQTMTECLDTDGLSGTTFEITNQCPEFSGENVDFSFEDGSVCVDYTGLSVGVDTACIFICDDLGDCDSMMFYISTINPDIDSPIANPDNATTGENATVNIPVLDNDSVEFVSTIIVLGEAENGNAYVTMDNQIAYEPNEAFCGTDNFSYIVCNIAECDTASVEVLVLCEDIKIFTGFSPNGDGVNDMFRISGIEAFPNCSVSIYNIWGNMVYQNEKETGYQNEAGWDGTWNGKQLVDGNYFYMIELNDDAKQTFSGYVLLHR